MNRISWPLVLSLAMALLLPSCWISRTQTNIPLTPTQLETVQPGRTTAKEVVEHLGAPSEVVQLGKRSAYRYQHFISKGVAVWLGVVFLQNNDTQSDRVWIWFDENDVVTHVGATFEADGAHYALPWSDRE